MIKSKLPPDKIHLLIDGIIFQLQRGRPLGISKVWIYLLEQIDQNNPFMKVTLIDRGYAPKFKNIEIIERKHMVYEDAKTINQENKDLDALMLELGANLFISTYFTNTSKHFSMCLLHDFIPEILSQNINEPVWIAKYNVIRSANILLGVSKSTLEDFHLLYPEFDNRITSLMYNAVDQTIFKQYPFEEVQALKEKLGIEGKYFVTVGNRLLYKNTIQFIKGLYQLMPEAPITVLMVGGYKRVEYLFKRYSSFNNNIRFINTHLTDKELSLALNGAECLAYPSLYEGFGLPILEAFSSYCPVILSNGSKASKEVAKDNAYYTNPHDVEDMARVIKKILESNPLKDVAILKSNNKYASGYTPNNSYNSFIDCIIKNESTLGAFYRNLNL